MDITFTLKITLDKDYSVESIAEYILKLISLKPVSEENPLLISVLSRDIVTPVRSATLTHNLEDNETPT